MTHVVDANSIFFGLISDSMTRRLLIELELHKDNTSCRDTELDTQGLPRMGEREIREPYQNRFSAETQTDA